MTIRFAMIGCGGFSRRYHVPTLLADSGAGSYTFAPYAPDGGKSGGLVTYAYDSLQRLWRVARPNGEYVQVEE